MILMGSVDQLVNCAPKFAANLPAAGKAMIYLASATQRAARRPQPEANGPAQCTDRKIRNNIRGVIFIGHKPTHTGTNDCPA